MCFGRKAGMKLLGPGCGHSQASGPLGPAFFVQMRTAFAGTPGSGENQILCSLSSCYIAVYG